jgi:hypothetical protein
VSGSTVPVTWTTAAAKLSSDPLVVGNVRDTAEQLTAAARSDLGAADHHALGAQARSRSGGRTTQPCSGSLPMPYLPRRLPQRNPPGKLPGSAFQPASYLG